MRCIHWSPVSESPVTASGDFQRRLVAVLARRCRQPQESICGERFCALMNRVSCFDRSASCHVLFALLRTVFAVSNYRRPENSVIPTRKSVWGINICLGQTDLFDRRLFFCLPPIRSYDESINHTRMDFKRKYVP